MQEKGLLFSNCTIVDKELFFVETYYGLPAKMNPESGDVSYFEAMENFLLKEGDSLSDIRTMGKRVYALEVSGENVIIFDLEQLRCQYVPLKCGYRKWGNFAAFEQRGPYFYIFSKYGNKICVMDTNTNEVTEIVGYFDGMEELQCSCRAGSMVWLIPYNMDVIGCYDLSNGRMKTYELGRKIENCMHAIFIDGKIYILNRYGIIYIWNIRDMKLSEIKTLETEHLEEESMCRMVYAGKKLIVLPLLAEEIKILDLSTDEVEIYHDYPENFLYYDISGWSKYYGLCEDDIYYYFAMRRENYLLRIKKVDGSLSWIKPNIVFKEERIKIRDILRKKKFKAYQEAGEVFFLENEMNIGFFVEKVPQKDNVAKKTNVGSEIFEKIKQSH